MLAYVMLFGAFISKIKRFNAVNTLKFREIYLFSSIVNLIKM